MKLRRIEADSFGALQNCALGDLGDGLTVVLGPNESGKSTYAALLRQVLYGFPDKRAKDYGYEPKSGGRSGKLVFEDATGRWAIFRGEGPKGGSVRVDALSGAARERLLSEVVGSVTEQTFRVVFGFGLDELDDIESGSDKDIVSRLFAGSMGLTVNPMDVRKTLSDAAATLFKTRGNAEVNTLLAEAKDVKAQMRELEAQAKAFAGDQARLKELESQLEPLKERRDEVDRSLRAVERNLERARNISREREDAAERAAEVADERAVRLREAEHTIYDARLLELSADLYALLEEESGAKKSAERAHQLLSRASELQRSAAALAVPEGIADTAEARAALEAWRDRKARLEVELDGAVRAAEAAEAKVIACLQASQTTAAASPARRPVPVAALLLVVLGLAGAVAGALTRQWIAAGLGGGIAVLGVAMLAFRGKGGSGVASFDDELVRARVAADESSQIAAKVRERLQAESAQWAGWLAQRGLGARGTEPAAVASLLDDARRRAEIEDQAAAAEAEAGREQSVSDSWGQRLMALVRGPLGVSDTGTEPHALAIRAREALATAADARDRKAKALEAIEVAELEAQRLAAKDAKRAEELEHIASEHGVEGDLIAALEERVSTLAQEAAEAAERCAEVGTAHDELVGRLGAQGREDALAFARQRLEGLDARAHAAADRYLVDALAVRLIDLARERFERDRQPEVVRTAERVFAEMTNGRYVGVRVPMGGESITVVSSAGEVLPTSRLSRGTAEQLYLALRVGLIHSFGEQGPHLPVLMDDIVVNYDAERVSRSSAAISELASSRQVVFFTCHEATANALTSAVPGATRITLQRCAF